MSLPSPLFCDNCGAANRSQAAFCTVCGRPLHTTGGTTTSNTLTGLLVTQHILKQRYRITDQIGQGGFGAVYRAEDIEFNNRPVAVKEMSQSSLTTPELIEATESFKREAMLLAGLTHPNLPRIYEQFTDTGRRYLVMDYIQGKTLEEDLKKTARGSLPVEQVLDIGLQLCTVLDYLHSRQPPIIFRDLKPANIMLTADKHLYLIDFGIARHFKPGQAKDTTALGSSGYAAPEQYGKAQSTPRSDIYGLGAVLHHLLTGNDPADSPFHFAPLQTANQPVLIALSALIMQMLEIDASKRPTTTPIVKQELQRIAALLPGGQTHQLVSRVPPGYQSTGVPVAVPRPKPASQPILPQPQSNTIFISTGHTSRVTALAWSPNGMYIASASYDKKVRILDAKNGTTLFIYRGHSDRVNALSWSPGSTRIASAGDDKTVQICVGCVWWFLSTYSGHTAGVNDIAWSPNGLRMASASSDKTVQVWEVVSGNRIFIYRGHSDEVQTLAWSPDGKRIVSGSNDKTVQIWDPLKETNVFTSLLFPNRGQSSYRGHVGRVNAVSWSPNGKRIASVGNDKTMHVWDTTNGKLIFIHRHPTSSINCIAWSPDSKYLASGSNDKFVQLWDTTTRNATTLYQGHTGYVTALAWSPDGTRIASTGVDRTVHVWQVK